MSFSQWHAPTYKCINLHCFQDNTLSLEIWEMKLPTETGLTSLAARDLAEHEPHNIGSKFWLSIKKSK